MLGGYANCGDAQPTARTTIVGTGSGSVVALDSVSGLRSVILRDLVIEGGATGGDGGGMHIGSTMAVRLDDTWVRGDDANHGGGIFIGGSGTDRPGLSLTNHSVIGTSGQPNSANDGGGIYCQGADVELAGPLIEGNIAGGNGGGLYLDDCTLASTGTPDLRNTMTSNSASLGAAIYATNGSSIDFGLAGGRTDIFRNTADAAGGGIYLSGIGTRAVLAASTLRSNDVDNNGSGGAVYVTAGARFDLDRGDRDEVCTVAPCSAMTGNMAARGSTAAIVGGGNVSIRRSEIVGPIDPGAQNAFYAAQSGSVINLDGVLMDRVPGFAGIWLENAAAAFINNLTMAGNDLSADFLLATADTQIGIADSIVWDAPAVAIAGSGSVFNTDNVSHDPATLPGLNLDPGFVDAASHDYHLRGDSPNVDAYAINPDTPATDIDGEPRPFDLAVDNGGTYDRGAYELGDEIFADGLEGE
ncbi:MAG: hypothetical protein WBV39_02915 [Rudaea sp.]